MWRYRNSHGDPLKRNARYDDDTIASETVRALARGRRKISLYLSEAQSYASWPTDTELLLGRSIKKKNGKNTVECGVSICIEIFITFFFFLFPSFFFVQRYRNRRPGVCTAKCLLTLYIRAARWPHLCLLPKTGERETENYRSHTAFTAIIYRG